MIGAIAWMKTDRNQRNNLKIKINCDQSVIQWEEWITAKLQMNIIIKDFKREKVQWV